MALSYPVKPIHPSPVVKWNNGNLSAIRQFVVPSENVDDFIEYLLGGFDLPTTFPGWPTVFVDSIEANPISACCFATPDALGYLEDPITDLEGYPSPGAGGYEDMDANSTCWWKVVVGYATKQVNAGQSGVRAGTWLSFNRNMSGKVVQLPSRNLHWEGTSEQLKEDNKAHIFVPLADINIEWDFVSESDLCATEANLLTMQGTLNNAAYGSAVFPTACSNPWETGTLLFCGYSVSTEIGRIRFGSYNIAVATKRTLNLTFKLSRVVLSDGTVLGWNYDYYDGSKIAPGWYRPVDSGGNPRYRSTNFANLFI